MSRGQRLIEPDTVEEVLRAGREVVALSLALPADKAPVGLRRATLDLQVMLNELEEQASGP